MKIFLLIIAFALKAILSPILLAYGIVRSITKREFTQWCLEISLSIDRMGNTFGKYLWNDFLGLGFGNSKETISSRLGKNEMFGLLKPIGKVLANILNKLEKLHCKKSIDFMI